MTTQPDHSPEKQNLHALVDEHPTTDTDDVSPMGFGQDPAPWKASPNRLLTVKQAAEFLNLSRSRVYELINSQAFPSVAIGRSRRIPLWALDNYVTSLLDGPDRHTSAPG